MKKEIRITCDCRKSLTVDQLQTFQGKLKSIDSEAFEKLKQSIVKYGFSFPIFVWKDQILDGHQRLVAVKKLLENGYTLKEGLLPVVPIQAKDRKVAAEKLLLINSRYAEIEQSGFDTFIADFEVDLEEISQLIEIPEIDFSLPDEPFEGNTDPDEVPEIEEEAITKTGDIWLLGPHRLMCGDSTNVEDVEALMDGEKADMVFTDPPYGVNYEGGHFHSGDVKIKRKREALKNDDSPDIYKKIIPLLIKYCDGPCYTWFSDREVITIYKAIENIGSIHALIIWNKINATYAAMNSQYKQRHETCLYWKGKKAKTRWCGPSDERTVWDIKRDSINNFHPTQKPVELGIRAIKNHDINIVLDLFCGSGSTIIAAQQTGRKCYAMEISPQYVDVTVKRWQEFVPANAILESTGQTFDEVKNERLSA